MTISIFWTSAGLLWHALRWWIVQRRWPHARTYHGWCVAGDLIRWRCVHCGCPLLQWSCGLTLHFIHAIQDIIKVSTRILDISGPFTPFSADVSGFNLQDNTCKPLRGTVYIYTIMLSYILGHLGMSAMYIYIYRCWIFMPVYASFVLIPRACSYHN